MTATAIDSTVFRHIFSSEPMRQVFSDENRVQCYLDIEERLTQRYPRLIVCGISGYGPSGPYRDKKAYDLLVQCETGLVSVTGTPDAFH